MRACLYMYALVYVHTVYACVCTCMHVCRRVQACMRNGACVRMCASADVCAYAHVHTGVRDRRARVRPRLTRNLSDCARLPALRVMEGCQQPAAPGSAGSAAGGVWGGLGQTEGAVAPLRSVYTWLWRPDGT